MGHGPKQPGFATDEYISWRKKLNDPGLAWEYAVIGNTQGMKYSFSNFLMIDVTCLI